MEKINMQAFCFDPKDEYNRIWNPVMYHPVNQRGYLYASNGRICIRIKKKGHDDRQPIGTSGKVLNMSHVFKNAGYKDRRKCTLKLPRDKAVKRKTYHIVFFGKKLIDEKYRDLMLTLPNCRWRKSPGGDLKPLYFTFTGGHGVVMPIKLEV